MRKLILIFLALLIALSGISPASAYNSSNGTNDPNTPSTWNQYKSGGGWDAKAPFSPFGKNPGVPAGPSSCGQFSMTSMMVRAGVKPKGYFTPDFRKEVRELYNANKAVPIGTDGFIIQSLSKAVRAQGINNLTKGQLTYEGTQCEGSFNCTAADLVKAYNDGYFTIFMVQFTKSSGGTGRHWVAVDSIGSDGKTINTIDSGFKFTTFPNSRYSNRIGWVVKFKRVDGKKPADLPVADKAGGPSMAGSGGSASSADPNSSAAPSAPTSTPAVDEKMLIRESDLEGMPSLTPGQKTQIEQAAVDPDAFVLPGPDDTTLTESIQLNEMNDAFNLQQTQYWAGIFSAVIAFVGLLLFIYAGIVILARAADATLGTGQVMRMVTFGAYESSDPSINSSSNDKRGLTWVKTIIFASSLAALGALLITGYLTGAVASLIRFFATL